MVQPKIKFLDILGYHRWFFLANMILVLAGGLIFTCGQQKVYKADAEIYITPKPAAAVEAGSAVADSDYRLINNQVEILSSDQVAEKAAVLIMKDSGQLKADADLNDEKTKAEIRSFGRALAGSVTVGKKDYTNVIALSMTGADKPDALQHKLKLYLDAYRATLTEINSQKSADEIKFLSDQLASSQAELDEVGNKLRDFESSNQTYNLDTQVNQLLGVASRLDEQNNTLKADIAATRSQILTSRQHLPTSPEYVNLMARIERDPEASELRRKIVNLEQEKAEWSSKVTDSHPKMIAYNQELGRLRSLLQTRLQSFGKAFSQKMPTSADGITTGSNLDFALAGDVINNEIKLESMEARSQTLAASQSQVMGLLRGVPQQALDYMKLKNHFDACADKVKTLARQLDESKLLYEAANSLEAFKALKKPTATFDPIRPNLQKNMMAALLLGLCWAAFAVFIRASLDSTLHWPFQVRGMLESDEEGVFTMPALPDRKIFTQMLERSNFTVPEPYKRLIIHLENMQKLHNVRRIGLMPVAPFEDCNITTVALSLYLTELSNKMVLIDTDFSKSSVSALVRSLKLPIAAALNEGPGLSDYLCGEAEDFVDVIYPLGKTVYGSFIPSGDPVHDTGFQFSHRNLGQLEENLSPNYNFVLYSLPSIQQSYDSLAVGRTLDGVILLVHPEVTHLDQIQQAVRDLEAVHSKVLGIIVQPLRK